MGKKWTAEQDSKLIEMRGVGKPYVEIAKALKRSEPAIQQRAFGLGLTKKHIKPTWWSAMMWWRK
jgi:hypothetical protein